MAKVFLLIVSDHWILIAELFRKFPERNIEGNIMRTLVIIAWIMLHRYKPEFNHLSKIAAHSK